jgi:hypothetical protein
MQPDDRLYADILMRLTAPQRPQLYPQRWSKHLIRCYLWSGIQILHQAKSEITKSRVELTEHATLFVYKRTEITKNLGELMYASLDLPYLSFAFLYE